MQVPTIEANNGIQTGSTGPQSSPEDMGAQVGQSLLGASNAIESGASALTHVARMQKEKQHLTDLSWAGQSIFQEKDYIHKWMQDPVNNTKESFPDDLQKLAQSRLQTYSKSAPNTKALLMFKQHFLPFANESYEAALGHAAKTTLTNAGLAIDKMSGDAMSSYRQSLLVPGTDAAGGLMKSIDQINQNIDQSFGTIAPTLATKLKEKVAVDGAYASMADNLNLATKIINGNSTLAEHERYTIMEHIRSAGYTKNSVERIAFDKKRSDVLADVELGNERGKIDLGEYQSYYPRDIAVAHKLRDDYAHDTLDKVNTFLKSTRSWNATDQLNAVSDLHRNAHDEQSKAVFDMAAQKVRQSVAIQEQNPISWLQQNNPRLTDITKQRMQLEQDLQKDPGNASLQSKAQQLRTEQYDLTLKYQGGAPAGNEEYFTGKWDWKKNPVTGTEDMTPHMEKVDDHKMYLNRPSNDRHLMTMDEAEQNADYINKGSPTQVLKLIRSVLDKYPGEKYQNLAFNDMVTLPKQGRGIKQEYQALFLHGDSPTADAIAGAIGNADILAKIQPDKKADFEKTLNSNPTWTAFSRTLIGDNNQRAEQIGGFKNAVLALAYSRSINNGEGAAAAVKSATSMVIGEKLGFTSVNGTPMMITRDRGYEKPRWTDDNIKEIGRRLNISLQAIDPREIKLSDEHGHTNFPVLSQAGTDKVKMQQLRNAITQRAYFQTGADGKSASLYYRDSENNFELRDKNNNAFVINFEDVMSSPMFDTYDQYTVSHATFEQSERIGRGKRGPNSDLQGLAGNTSTFLGRMFGHMTAGENNGIYKNGDLSATNWPVHLDFIKRMNRLGGVPIDDKTLHPDNDPELRKPHK